MAVRQALAGAPTAVMMGLGVRPWRWEARDFDNSSRSVELKQRRYVSSGLRHQKWGRGVRRHPDFASPMHHLLSPAAVTMAFLYLYVVCVDLPNTACPRYTLSCLSSLHFRM